MPWGNLLVEFGLFTSRPVSVCAFLVRDLAGRAVNRTHEIAELRRDQLPSLGIQDRSSQPLVDLWQVARIAFAKRGSFGTNSNTDLRINNSSLIRTMAGKQIDDSSPARRLRWLHGELALPSNFLDQGPAARIRSMAEAGASLEKITEFSVSGCQLNFLRQVGKSLPPVRSGAQCLLSFCPLLRIAPIRTD